MDVMEAAKEAMSEPEYYFGSMTDLVHEGWGKSFGRHRDSDNLDNSNFETILEQFSKSYELNSDYRVEGSTHWAVGWTDTLMVRVFKHACVDQNEIEDFDSDDSEANIWPAPDWESKGHKWFICHGCNRILNIYDVQPIFVEACEIADALQDYPLLDEEDYSRREHEDVLDYIEQEFHYAVGHLELPDDVHEKVTHEDVARYLFDVHSVSHIDDISDDWITEAVKELYYKPATDEEIERSFDAYR